jgi:hypothetical protein
MSWQCRYLMGTEECRIRGGKVCNPGDPGCVLFGKFEFPLKDAPKPRRTTKKS